MLILIIGETEYEDFGNSLYYLCNFSVNLKMFFKIVFFKKGETKLCGGSQEEAAFEKLKSK